MTIQNIVVCPPQIRPLEYGSSSKSQDDLTHQYIQILKANNQLKKIIDKAPTSTTIESNFDILQANIVALMNNDIISNRVIKNSIPIKSLTNRLKGKKGVLEKI